MGIEKDTRGGVLYAPFACVLVARQEQPRLNQEKNVLKYIFLNGIAGVVAERRYTPRSYANNYNVHGANGKFVKM